MMKKFMITVLVVASLMITAGIVGSATYHNNDQMPYGNDGNGYFRQGMMYDVGEENQGKVLDIAVLKEHVNNYISGINENLVIADTFIYKDSDYYFSIVEKDTGLGAMELLVNPYTGSVYPEFGPNMMWNLKYGMHNDSGYGMMGTRGRGMIGRNAGGYYPSKNAEAERNTIPVDEAKQLAENYLQKNTKLDYTVSNDMHEFYGYYTFHLEKDRVTAGMLSINGLTGEVWFHDWHGTLDHVIEGQ